MIFLIMIILVVLKENQASIFEELFTKIDPEDLQQLQTIFNTTVMKAEELVRTHEF